MRRQGEDCESASLIARTECKTNGVVLSYGSHAVVASAHSCSMRSPSSEGAVAVPGTGVGAVAAAAAGAPPTHIEHMNVSHNSRMHIGPQFVSVTQNVHQDRVVKGEPSVSRRRYSTLCLLSPCPSAVNAIPRLLSQAGHVICFICTIRGELLYTFYGRRYEYHCAIPPLCAVYTLCDDDVLCFRTNVHLV